MCRFGRRLKMRTCTPWPCGTRPPWRRRRLLEANVLGTQHVLEAARRGGTERVVLASSNRVTGFYPAADLTGPQDPVRADGLYGGTGGNLRGVNPRGVPEGHRPRRRRCP
ncbi:NAD-dependent epimerase/dehydratase family protein [Streptomyces sp. 7N604]|uniref:NAD-dependent epimerase/dehydratase family protein n=1 Tax=Streptomyces sp. 7N604 TaxID=3457415 RepID=UPI003FD3346C